MGPKAKGPIYEYIVRKTSLIRVRTIKIQPRAPEDSSPRSIHAGKLICESMIIVEYIDEIRPQNPLLPPDPLERALARFWVKYAEDKSSAVWALFRSSGEELEKAKRETLEFLKVVEDQCLGDEKKFFGGDSINIVDIVFGTIVHWLGIVGDVVEVKLLEDDKFPRLHSWITNFRDVPTIRVQGKPS